MLVALWAHTLLYPHRLMLLSDSTVRQACLTSEVCHLVPLKDVGLYQWPVFAVAAVGCCGSGGGMLSYA